MHNNGKWHPLYVFVLLPGVDENVGFAEPWKWFLITTGMVKGCGFTWKQAILVTVTTIIVVVLLFWSLAPVIVQMRGLMG